MANPRNKKAVSKQAGKLAEALNFVGNATSFDESAPWKEHARLAGGMMTATNGQLSAGHPIDEELAICPHLGRFIEAINKAGKTLSLTARDNGQLLVSGDKIKATIPCLPGEHLPPVMPDPNIAVVDDRIKAGFNAVVKLADNQGDRVIETSLLLRANSVFASNGAVIFEYWHGIDLPPGLVIPKPFAVAVGKQTVKLIGFGFSRCSVTFYFENGAWMKTQLYQEEWPNVDQLFDVQAFPTEVPAGLFEAVDAIKNFSKDGGLYFFDGKLKSSYDNYGDESGPVYGATYEVEGLQSGHAFSANLLKLIEPACKLLDYTTNEDRAVFTGDNVRGVIMKRSRPAEPPPPPQTRQEAPQEPVALPAGVWGALPAGSCQDEGCPHYGTPHGHNEPSPAARIEPDRGGQWVAGVFADDAADERRAEHTEQFMPFDPWAGIVQDPAFGVKDDDVPF